MSAPTSGLMLFGKERVPFWTLYLRSMKNACLGRVGGREGGESNEEGGRKGERRERGREAGREGGRERGEGMGEGGRNETGGRERE